MKLLERSSGGRLTIVPTGLHKNQHRAAGKRKDQRDRQTLQQHVPAQSLSAAAAKVVRSSVVAVGAVAMQITAVKDRDARRHDQDRRVLRAARS
jgi:hypothetical protein